MTIKRKIWVIIPSVLAVGLLAWVILFPLGGRYWGKERANKYAPRLSYQPQYHSELYSNGPIYLLPEQYPFFGRTEMGDVAQGEPPLITLYDRLVDRFSLAYNGQTYYYYFSSGPHSYNITYPDFYNSDTDEIAFSLWENPDGYFIEGHYLYYVYGKDYVNVKTNMRGVFDDGGIHYLNYKDYHYARLDLDALKNEKISKKQYEEKYLTLEKSLFPGVYENNSEGE